MAALRLGGAQAIFWASHGLIMEGRQWLQAALDQTAALPESQGGADRQLQAAQANSLIGISQLNYGDGDYKTSLDACQAGVQQILPS